MDFGIKKKKKSKLSNKFKMSNKVLIVPIIITSMLYSKYDILSYIIF